MESGNVLPETCGSASRTWDQSLYLQHRRHELRDVLKDLDFNQPEIDGLEVIGSGQPFTSVTVKQSPLMEEEEREELREMEQNENHDPLSQFDYVMLDAVLVPALRFCGQPARWTGNSTSHKGEVGISARVTFEALSGERARSDMEVQNEGSTAVYYSWQRLAVPHSFPDARTHTYTQHFYFDTSTGVILPGDSKRVEFIFKSEVPGIRTKVWHLNTHPVLLGGASIQVTLRGVALYQDKTADQRHALERELQQRGAASVCRSLVCDVLRGVLTPERPGSPAELYTTEEEHFHNRNPKLQYRYETVEALKSLWQQVTTETGEDRETAWDLSVSTLRQAVLALPQGDGEQDGPQERLTREGALSLYNTLLLELTQPLTQHTPLPHNAIGLQLWRELLDGLVSAALWLRHLLGLPESDTWGEHTQDHNHSWGKTKKEEKFEKKAGAPLKEEKRGGAPLKEEKKGGAPLKEEKRGGSVKEREEKKGAAKPAVKEKPVEECPGSKKKGREEVAVGDKRPGGKTGKEPGREPSSTTTSPESDYQDHHTDSTVEPELQDKYRRQLHQQVYILMEGLVDSLCVLLDESAEEQT
uniref:MYCBP-associated protein-like n=1 Tax=Oncorhynchus gorbuscha TaxID=8017 RepID=UPI001EAF7A54|nr:MYCBP-associated protein-like [Oncorhynchus gorbuscha]